VLPEVVFRRTYTGPVPPPDDGVDPDAGDNVTRSLPDQGSFFLVIVRLSTCQPKGRLPPTGTPA
jgi:hypothetical protein